MLILNTMDTINKFGLQNQQYPSTAPSTICLISLQDFTIATVQGTAKATDIVRTIRKKVFTSTMLLFVTFY